MDFPLELHILTRDGFSYENTSIHNPLYIYHESMFNEHVSQLLAQCKVVRWEYFWVVHVCNLSGSAELSSSTLSLMFRGRMWGSMYRTLGKCCRFIPQAKQLSRTEIICHIVKLPALWHLILCASF